LKVNEEEQMARTNVVKSARKAQGKCRSCGKEINVGDPYKWAKPRYRGKVVVCGSCAITASMVSSSKMVAIWEEMEGINSSDVDSLPDSLRTLAETVRQVGEEYQESADNQREYFPNSEQADENEEKANDLDSWADELESAADEIESALAEMVEMEVEKETLEGEKGELEDKLDGGFYDMMPDETKNAQHRVEEIDDRIEEIETDIENKQNEIDEHAGSLDNCPC